jgi:ketosteroid isomerase-like protein
MRTIIAFAVSTLLAAGAPSPEDPELFSRLEHVWMNAVKNRDLATLETILAPEFHLTIAVAGQPLWEGTRESYLEKCRGWYVIHSFEFHEVRPLVHGDIAVVTSRYSQKATLGGTQDRSGEFLLTDVWRKRDGRWQVAVRYSSRPEPVEGSPRGAPPSARP